MATVVYMPKDERSEKLGELIGSGLQAYFRAKQKRQADEQEQEVLRSMANAGNRRRAAEVATTSGVSDPTTFERRMKVLDTLFPEKQAELPTEVKAYNPETGETMAKFIPKTELETLNTPEGIAKYFGSERAVVSPTNMEDYFKPKDGAGYTYAGRAPASAPPTGTIPLKEIERIEKEQAANRAERAANLAEDRFNLMLNRLTTAEDKSAATALISNMKAYNNVVSNLLNVKKSIGDQGELILDFEGDSKKALAYRTALESASEYVDKFKGDINKAAVSALRDAGYYEEPTPEVPTPEAPAATPPRRPSPLKTLGLTGATPSTRPKAAAPVAPATIAKPQTKADFDKLPKGAHFINPADGKEYIKE